MAAVAPVRSRPVPEFAFDVDTAVVASGDGRWRGQVSDRWDIGAVPNGGYVLCIALASVRAAVRQPDPLTVTAHYLGPCGHGEVDTVVDVLKEGRSLSTASARLMQGGQTRLAVLATFGDLASQRGPTLVTAQPPELAPPDECGDPKDRPVGLGFSGHPSIQDRIEFRPSPATVERLRQRGGAARIEGWIRLADGRPLDVHCLPLLVDAAPPAVFGAMETGWVPTLELTVHVRGRPAPSTWLKGAASTSALINGLLEEEFALWDESGNLVAMSRQLARLLPPS